MNILSYLYCTTKTIERYNYRITEIAIHLSFKKTAIIVLQILLVIFDPYALCMNKIFRQADLDFSTKALGKADGKISKYVTLSLLLSNLIQSVPELTLSSEPHQKH